MYQKILVPLDGSDLAEAALPHAKALAKTQQAQIIILRIPELPAPHLFLRNPALSTRIVEDAELETEAYLQKELGELSREGIRASSLMREGPVPETILEVADEIHADLIAMSTHGRTGMERWLLGSVADKVVHHAHIPVMLIHPN